MAQDTPPPRKGIKGLGIGIAIIFALIVVTFIGHNIFYATNG